jgi:predicted metal-dependent HD superfamily phosphohydrolase
MDGLTDRWPLRGADDLRDRLLAAYAGPERGYHDRRHLGEVLDRLDELLDAPLGPVAPTGVDVQALRLAAWFHDAVYDATAEDEERSARLAEGTLPAAGVSGAVVAEVARLVRLTQDHDPGAGDLAGQLLCDADLAILAAAPPRYAEYARGVRREYAHLDEATFREGRLRVLDRLASRRRLFHTAPACERWEPAARANLAAEIASLHRP